MEQSEVFKNMEDAKTTILPAVIEDVNSNGFVLSAYLTRHKLVPTKENFLVAINACLHELTWTVKPAKLVFEENNAKPIKLESNVKIVEDNHKKQIADEAQRKQNEENARYEQLVGQTIAGYVHTDKFGRKVFSATETFQRTFSATANLMRKQGFLPKAIYERVLADRTAQEAADEKRRERV